VGTVSPGDIRDRLEHPVIDADGHLIEVPGLFADFLREVAGPGVAARWGGAARGGRDPGDGVPAGSWAACPPWWSVPPDARDRAAACVPGILHRRLDELGIDLSILYPSLGLVLVGLPDDELRQACCRALNT
jgi:hypothetical protein